MKREFLAFLIAALALSGISPAGLAARPAKGAHVEILTVPCDHDKAITPTITVKDIASVGDFPRHVAVKMKTTALPSGEYYTQLFLPGGQYMLDDYSVTCGIPSEVNLTIVDGFTRHLLVQTVHGMAILKGGGFYGVAVQLPVGVPPPVLKHAGQHLRRPIVDGNVAYIENLAEGKYVLEFPFGIYSVCKTIDLTRGKPAWVVVHADRANFTAALKSAEKRGFNPGSCQSWI